MFKLQSEFKTIPPQKSATLKISQNIKNGEKDQVLLGVTGCGKTFIAANVIEKVKKPVLIISHNKTLAAQTYQEFKEFFPENAVHYFVSYYDYYQPEAYIPQSDTYISKDAKVNDIIDRLRHESTQSLMTRNDVIVVASVSCIYNIGSPENYKRTSLFLKNGRKIKRKELLLNLTRLQYKRNDINFEPGTFRIRGDFVEVFLPTGKTILKINNQNDLISQILVGENKPQFENKFYPTEKYYLFPAKFWITPLERNKIAIKNIKNELKERLKDLKKANKLLEAQRLERQVNYDMEMIEETGWCSGIENYSSHFEFRNPGDPPFTLFDYYPRDFLLIIDESHMTIPQIRAMYEGDKKRKESLVNYGFRLTSAFDNRPLKFKEFEKKFNQAIYISATPGAYESEKMNKFNSRSFRSLEMKKAQRILQTEVLIRPTGLLDPIIKIKPIENQVQDLIKEAKRAIEKKERILVTTLTKRLAEDLSDYLEEKGFKVQYLHSEIKTLERPGILKDLREGKYDIIVGINLLREGLDLPEVALIAILDADKEGFLRNETTLIQTMGRAARHPNGRVVMYADEITNSIKRAINETKRRRKIQKKYNKENKITPKGIKKEIRQWEFNQEKRERTGDIEELAKVKDKKFLTKEMEKAAKNFDFEKAAKIRDEIKKLVS